MGPVGEARLLASPSGPSVAPLGGVAAVRGSTLAVVRATPAASPGALACTFSGGAGVSLARWSGPVGAGVASP